jgi:hypothetical protein
MDRMSTLDSSFLYAEDGVTHMHIGSCAVFAGPAPSYNEFVAMMAAKLPQLPRYRQTIRFVPEGLGHPVWVDDSGFDLGAHLSQSVLPFPGAEK